jgi:hypothetical protein
MCDFFISYTGANEQWAEWIAWCLESDGLLKALVYIDLVGCDEPFSHLPQIRKPERREFFEQLSECLAEYPQLTLLISMREDYLASLDSFARYLPDRMRAAREKWYACSVIVSVSAAPTGTWEQVPIEGAEGAM